MFHKLNFNHWHHLKTPPQTHVSAFVMKTTKKILSASPLTAGPLHQSPAPCGISVIETGNDANPNLCACFKCRFLSCELEGGVWRCLSYRTMFRLTVQCRRFFITELLRVYSSDSFTISLAVRRDPHPPTGCFGSTCAGTALPGLTYLVNR